MPEKNIAALHDHFLRSRDPTVFLHSAHAEGLGFELKVHGLGFYGLWFQGFAYHV